MTQKSSRKRAAIALWFVSILIALAAFFALMQWARHQNPLIAETLTFAFGLFVLGVSLITGHRVSQGLDEVEVAQQRIANSLGWVWGGFATILLLMLPPVMNGLIEFVNAVVNVRPSASPLMTNRRLVTVAFFFGSTLIMVMQALAIIVVAIIWQRRMGRGGQQP